jgi:HEPN domain-containing protein
MQNPQDHSDELCKDWIEKAETDWVSAFRELRARNLPNYSDACFHAQQCAEKYIKALLVKANIPFEKIHDLIKLINLLPSDSEWNGRRTGLQFLSTFAVKCRYPGMTANKLIARKAISHCKSIRDLARTRLRL